MGDDYDDEVPDKKEQPEGELADDEFEMRPLGHLKMIQDEMTESKQYLFLNDPTGVSATFFKYGTAIVCSMATDIVEIEMK